MKKGVFYTFLAILISLLVMTVLIGSTQVSRRGKSEAVSQRVRAMDSFLTDLENDFERELYIGGYRSILSLQKIVRQQRDFIDDMDLRISEILVNGTFNGTQVDLMFQDGQGADISSWNQRVGEEAGKLSLDAYVLPRNITVIMADPWTVRLHVNTTITLSDRRGLASWMYDHDFTKDISILGFEDPMYTVMTQDKISNLVFSQPTMDFVDDATNDTQALRAHLNSSLYAPSSTGPDFLMRFTGENGTSPAGIESLVDLDDLQRQGIAVRNKTIVDHIYFSDESTADYCDIAGMMAWFRLDKAHAGIYEVDLLEKTDCD